MCSKAVLLLFAFVCLASAKHKELNKFNICDLFPVKKPHIVTSSPSSTTALPATAAYVGAFESVQMTANPVSTQQEVQHSVQEPELLNPQQEFEYSQDQEFQYPQQQELQYPSYPPYQVVQYPQQMTQYLPQQVMPYVPQQVVQPTQQGLQYQTQQDVKYPQTQPELLPQQQESQHQYPQDVNYSISQQNVQPPKQELQYQSQQEVKDHEEVQPPQSLQYQQQQQAVKPPKYDLEYQPLKQEVQNQPIRVASLPQQTLKFPPQQGNRPPYFQDPLSGYGSTELSYYQQQMRPNKKLYIGYFDNQNNFHNLRPHYAVRQQHPDSSQYVYSYPLNFLQSASAQIFPQQIIKST